MNEAGTTRRRSSIGGRWMTIVAALLPVIGGGASCTTARPSVADSPQPPATTVIVGDSAAAARARADSVRRPYTEADARFMTAMIHHHAQAIEVSRLAPANGASDGVRRLAARIINSQQDEIVTMQQWLADRGRTPSHGHGDHANMPGMLTPAQVAQLEAARGTEFDRLFLTLMIEHHRGAITMVQELFGTPGAGQDEKVFRFATDVQVDQATEIERMRRMLADLTFTTTPR